MRYWVFDAEAHKAQGPYDLAGLKKLPDFGPESLIAPEDAASAGQWKPAKTFEDMRSLFLKAPPLPASRPSPPPIPAKPAPVPRQTAPSRPQGAPKPENTAARPPRKRISPRKFIVTGIVLTAIVAAGWSQRNSPTGVFLQGFANGFWRGLRTSDGKKESSRPEEAASSAQRKRKTNSKRRVSAGAKMTARKRQAQRQPVRHRSQQVNGFDALGRYQTLTKRLAKRFKSSRSFYLTPVGLGSAVRKGRWGGYEDGSGKPIADYKAFLAQNVEMLQSAPYLNYYFPEISIVATNWTHTMDGVNFIGNWPLVRGYDFREMHYRRVYVRSKIKLPPRRYYWLIGIFSNEMKTFQTVYQEKREFPVIDLVACFGLNQRITDDLSGINKDEWVLTYDATLFEKLTKTVDSSSPARPRTQFEELTDVVKNKAGAKPKSMSLPGMRANPTAKSDQ